MRWWLCFWLSYLQVLLLCGGSSTSWNDSCSSRNAYRVKSDVDIHFINLPQSVSRRLYMHSSLKYFGWHNAQRVHAITPSEVHLSSKFRYQYECARLEADEVDVIVNDTVTAHSASNANHTSSQPKRTFIVDAYCGRPKNTPRELTVTMSHLLALYEAVHRQPASQSPFALILEDDLHFFLDIDLPALIASAPEDFVVLQLVTSNDYSVRNLWRVYLRHGQLLWVRRKDKDDYWCAGGYIVHKERLKGIVDRILRPLPPSYPLSVQRNSAIYLSSIIAGYASPCWPKYCCEGSRFNATPPCIRSSRGFQSDSYLFSLAPGHTYMLTVPILTHSYTGNSSTVHQQHVAFHQAAFRRGRKIMLMLLMKLHLSQFTSSSFTRTSPLMANLLGDTQQQTLLRERLQDLPVPAFISTNCTLGYGTALLHAIQHHVADSEEHSNGRITKTNASTTEFVSQQEQEQQLRDRWQHLLHLEDVEVRSLLNWLLDDARPPKLADV